MQIFYCTLSREPNSMEMVLNSDVSFHPSAQLNTSLLPMIHNNVVFCLQRV